eukprot:14811627-Alexandrium_andersonii.AAC.1
MATDLLRTTPRTRSELLVRPKPVIASSLFRFFARFGAQRWSCLWHGRVVRGSLQNSLRYLACGMVACFAVRRETVRKRDDIAGQPAPA